MALILTRSPYFVSREDLDNDAALKLEIGTYIDGDTFEISKTYNLAFRNAYLMDISPLVRDYLASSYSWSSSASGGYVDTSSGERVRYIRITLSGSKNGVAQADVVDEAYISDGYLYSTDDYNKDFSTELQEKSYYAGSTNLVYKLDDSDIQVPLVNTVNDLISGGVINSETVTATYYKNDEIKGSRSVLLDNEFSYYGYAVISSVEGGSDFGGNNNTSYRFRVEADGGVYEESQCLNKFFRQEKIQDFDKILLSNESGNVHEIRVKTVEECKHKPYRVSFLNRFGVMEDLWFFKRSDSMISINKEMFRGNSIGSYNAGDGVKTMQQFNVNGYEKITLNSGFVEEEMNEAFRQLLLSEEITLYDYKENKEYNVNIATSELQYKQHVNDKLINYTIEFEFAHEVINNVG